MTHADIVSSSAFPFVAVEIRARCSAVFLHPNISTQSAPIIGHPLRFHRAVDNENLENSQFSSKRNSRHALLGGKLYSGDCCSTYLVTEIFRQNLWFCSGHDRTWLPTERIAINLHIGNMLRLMLNATATAVHGARPHGAIVWPNHQELFCYFGVVCLKHQNCLAVREIINNR